jgi:hypothetical protein
MAFELVCSKFLTSLPAVEDGTKPHLHRVEERSPIAVPLVVCGLNFSGKLFFELAHIQDISSSGCRIYLCTRPQTDSPLAVRLVTDQGVTRHEIAQMLFQVAWIRPEEQGWAVGAYSLGSKDLRTLVFPLQKT